jgi:hypothetical protein
MGDPSGLVMAAQGVSAVTQMGQAYNESQAIRQQGRYQANEHGFNSRMAMLQAQDAEQRGEQDVQSVRLERRRLVGRQRAAAAAGGVDVNAGSALAAQEETAYYGELDALTAKRNAYREALGYESESIAQVGKARMARLAARNESRSTLLTGGLGATRDVLGAYDTYQKRKK